MSFLYPRTISITRQAAPNAVGAVGYNGRAPVIMASIASGIPASIQLKSTGSKPGAGLPTDTAKRSYWRIYFAGALGLVTERDIITDDLGKRYQVTAATWSPLGYSALCDLLEV